MPFEMFDRSKLQLKDLNEREHDIDISIMMDISKKPTPFNNESIDIIVKKIKEAKKKGATVMMMMGAHVIRAGCGPWLIKLMEEGYITHFALNGAGAIHDFEFAMIGATTESVAKYISEGQFGLWKQSGYINDYINKGVKEGLGFGEALGKAIWESDFKYKNTSLLAMGYKLHIPITIHVGIGLDFIHQHASCDGALTGLGSYRDFLIYAKSIQNLENGVFLNFGSAVTGPEVYLKALSMARNVAHQQNKVISHFTTAVFDLLEIDQNTKDTPKKSDARYYFRPWKTILARTVSDGGKGYYIQGTHDLTVSNMAYKLLQGE